MVTVIFCERLSTIGRFQKLDVLNIASLKQSARLVFYQKYDPQKGTVIDVNIFYVVKKMSFVKIENDDELELLQEGKKIHTFIIEPVYADAWTTLVDFVKHDKYAIYLISAIICAILFALFPISVILALGLGAVVARLFTFTENPKAVVVASEVKVEAK